MLKGTCEFTVHGRDLADLRKQAQAQLGELIGSSGTAFVAAFTLSGIEPWVITGDGRAALWQAQVKADVGDDS